MIQKNVGIIPRILLLNFVLGYCVSMEWFSQLYLPVTGMIFATGAIYLIDKYSRNNFGIIRKSLIPFYIYALFLGAALLTSTMFAISPGYSAVRVIIAVSLFVFQMILFYEMNEAYHRLKKWRKFLIFSFFVFLSLLLLVQLVNPNWIMGSIRMTGGTNPNLISFFALFIVFVTHYSALVDKKWSKTHIMVYILGSVVILWSMSRSVIMSWIILYALYFLYQTFYEDIARLFKGKLSIRLITRSVLTIISILIVIFIIKYIQGTLLYYQLVNRFTGTEGVDLRSSAWEVLLGYFSNNPLFGGVGWWYATEVLDGFVGANSPHNLYVRLLSEVGLIGTFAVLIFPIAIILILALLAFSNKLSGNLKSRMILVSGFLIAIFAGQYFEDRYLIGYMQIANTIFVWPLALGLFLIINHKRLGSQSDDIAD